jgi:endonuclease-8
MPEGDTIFRTAASLRRWLTGRTVTGARTVVPGLDCRRLVGRRVDGVDAQGKHLLIRLSGGLIIHSHMRMTGSWHVYPTGERWRRPARQARLVVEAGDRTAVCFNAPVVELIADHEERAHPSLRRLGPDVLDPGSLDPEVVRRRARARADASPTIGELLLDQQVVAGIGNIYRCETLFLEGVHPWTPSAAVDDATLDALVATASRLMLGNVTTGSPISRDFDGGPDHPWVYRRGGLDCRRCGTTVERGVLGRQARPVYWCPSCQPAERAR